MIEKVGYSKPVTSARNLRKAGSADAAAFASALSSAEAAQATESAAPIAPMTSIGLLGIQEMGEEETQRRRAYKRGRLTIDALEKLRDGLLMGAVPLSTLRSLEKLVKEERAITHDLTLNGILDEIELRAAVEIAKLEVAGLI
jgi:hypothetical protein